MKAVVLVRHASAGDRKDWPGDDAERPLDKKGRRQAQALIQELAEYEFGRIVSSPAVRCVQTVEPLAERLGLEVEQRDELMEGARREETLALVDEVRSSGAVLCTHGDVVEELLGARLKKGAAALLEP